MDVTHLKNCQRQRLRPSHQKSFYIFLKVRGISLGFFIFLKVSLKKTDDSTFPHMLTSSDEIMRLEPENIRKNTNRKHKGKKSLF
jgi:hypothetical protein